MAITGGAGAENMKAADTIDAGVNTKVNDFLLPKGLDLANLGKKIEEKYGDNNPLGGNKETA